MAAVAHAIDARPDARPVRAIDVRAAGVAFVRDGHARIWGMRGPKSVCAAAAAEIARRAQIFVDRFPAPDVRVPLIRFASTPPADGTCCHCGEPLPPPFSGGGCDLCHAALLRALRATGRVP